ncbi:nitrilase-related carbon-nitrogen hydrolase [Spirosoma validum]|uniref:nitrilase-related carbon-nitrogen hydrolase n=1 Tax=Spirosoma validum TaxID=2771355 RepID=UPI001CC2890E|nr:nitrilase-related carbon-nitrogen hydrolase [Spirosoma validum]
MHWENPVANRTILEEKLADLTEPTDLIVLPETFTTGFTMNPTPVSEIVNLDTTRRLRQISAQYQAVVTGSFVVKEINTIIGSYGCSPMVRLIRATSGIRICIYCFFEAN